ITNFVPFDMPVEIMRVRVVNRSSRNRLIIPTSFIPLYGRSEKNLRDHRHVSSLLNRLAISKYGVILTPTMIFDETGHKQNITHYYTLAFDGKGAPPQGQFPTLDYFYGQGDIFSPDAIYKDVQPVNKKLAFFDGKEACAAFRFQEKVLKPKEAVDYFIVMGITDKLQDIKGYFLALNSREKVEVKLQQTKDYWQHYLSRINFDFQENSLNNWLLWVKFQPTLRKLFGCSFLPHFDYGKGGRGWRDLWQDTLALLLTEPIRARPLILNNFNGVRIDGSNATIITREGGFISDRNRISRVWMDHGVWPYLALKLYMNRCSDTDILLEELNYFSDHQTKRAKGGSKDFNQKDFILRTKKKKIYRGTVLEHVLVENLVQFFNVGRHNIICLENADWNDGLDMAAEYGESVAFSFMYAHNLKDLCFFLKDLKRKSKKIYIFKELVLLLDTLSGPVNYSDYLSKQKRLEDYFKSTGIISGDKIAVDVDILIKDLERKSGHLFKWLSEKEWLKEKFFNGYYDNCSRRVEGRRGNDVRMMLSSQVFALMSGSLSPDRITDIWKAIKKFLQDKELGGIHLNTDFSSLQLDFGRAFGFSYGDKENGAFFSHMTVMLANALYKNGFIQEGREILNSIYTMAIDNRAKIYPLLPEYFNNQGRGLYFYLTGSASWYIYTLVEEVLGLKFILGDLCLSPKLCQEDFYGKNKLECEFSLSNKRFKVIYTRQNSNKKVLSLTKVMLQEKEFVPFSGTCLIRRKEFSAKEVVLKAYLG
ncbi:MAG: cellobiose phosphorylase, partial [Candidatus Omnitrophota bacterium]